MLRRAWQRLRRWGSSRECSSNRLNRQRPQLEELESRLVPTAITFVQNLGTNASSALLSSSMSIAIPAAGVGAGTDIVVEFTMDVVNSAVSVTDSQGNVYHLDAAATGVVGLATVQTDIFSSEGVKALAAGQTITVTFPNTALNKAVSAAEFTGLTGVSALDKTSTASGLLTSSPSSGSTATTTQANELVLGAIGVQSLTATTFTPGSGYTALTAAGPAGLTNVAVDPEYQIVSATGSFQANGTTSASLSLFAGAVATYKADSTTHFQIVVTPPNPTVGTPVSVTVTALDGNNNQDAGYTGTIQLTSSDPTATLPPPYTFTVGPGGDNGQHTFTGVDFGTPGSQTISAQDTTSSGTTGTSPNVAVEAVTSSTATHLQLVATPTTPTAGTPFTLTVTALDANGNIVTDYTSTVHFTSSAPNVSLPGDYIFQPADAGVHSFPVTIGAGGVVLLTSTDVEKASISGSLDVTADNPVPTISSVTPGSPDTGTGAVTFTVDGTNFVPSSQVLVNGSPVATTVISSTEATAPIDEEGTFTVNVRNPAPGGGTSNTMSVTGPPEFLPDGTTGTADQRYVIELYEDLLNRVEDVPGLNYWVNLMNQGITKPQIVAGFVNSLEYRMDLVQSLYQKYLHRAADSGGMSFWVSFLAEGGSAQTLSASIIGSTEYFQNRAGSSQAGFLTILYADALNRAVDPSGQSGYSQQLLNGASTTSVALQILGSTEFDQDLVTSYYFAYLDRAPDSGGLNAWVSFIQQGQADEQILESICGSPEYYNKTVPTGS